MERSIQEKNFRKILLPGSSFFQFLLFFRLRAPFIKQRHSHLHIRQCEQQTDPKGKDAKNQHPKEGKRKPEERQTMAFHQVDTVAKEFFCGFPGITGVQEKKTRKREHKPEEQKKRCKYQNDQKPETEVACTGSQKKNKIENAEFNRKRYRAVDGNRFRMRGERIKKITKRKRLIRCQIQIEAGNTG